MDEKKKKRGRPKGTISSDPASATIPRVRIKPAQLEAYHQAAEASEKTLSAWVRDTLDAAIKKEIR